MQYLLLFEDDRLSNSRTCQHFKCLCLSSVCLHELRMQTYYWASALHDRGLQCKSASAAQVRYTLYRSHTPAHVLHTQTEQTCGAVLLQLICLSCRLIVWTPDTLYKYSRKKTKHCHLLTPGLMLRQQKSEKRGSITIGPLMGSVSCSRTLQHAAQPRFEPATFQSLGNLLYLLSYSRPFSHRSQKINDVS